MNNNVIQLELSMSDLLMVKSGLERECIRLYNMNLDYARQQLLLERIYSIVAPEERTERLNVKRMKRDYIVRDSTLNMSSLVLC